MRVTVIEQRGAAAVVEWRDGEGLHRAIVPHRLLSADKDEEPYAECALAVLQQGIPFGESWEALALGQIGAERVAQALRARGLWTAQDVLQHVERARAALAAAYSKDLETLLNAARAASRRRED